MLMLSAFIDYFLKIWGILKEEVFIAGTFLEIKYFASAYQESLS
jgi:hypothetical protein